MTKYTLTLTLAALMMGGSALMADEVHCPQKQHFMQTLAKDYHINAPGRGAIVWAPSQDHIEGQPIEFTLDFSEKKNISNVNDLKERLVGLDFQGADSVQNPDGTYALQCNYTYKSPEGVLRATATAPLPKEINTAKTAPTAGTCVGEHCYFEVTHPTPVSAQPRPL